MDFLSRKSCREQKVLTLFFSLSKQQQQSQNREKNKREKKTVILFAARLLQRRREMREMSGPLPPNRLLLPCWQDVMLDLGIDSLRECQREILNRAGFPT